MELIIGKKYQIKNFTERPTGWNGIGKLGEGGMDHFIGRIVTIRSTGPGSITIEEDDRNAGEGRRSRSFWYFSPSDFQEIIEPFKFDEELFEI